MSGHTLIVGISGLSSTGKTTLAQHLRQLFRDITIPLYPSSGDNNNVAALSFDVSIIHQDDFYLPESSLPVRKVTVADRHAGTEELVELVDWDFPGALNFLDMTKALRLLRQGVAYKEVQIIRGKDGTMSESEKEDNAPDQVPEAISDGEDRGATGVTENALKELREEFATKLAAVQWTSITPWQSVKINLVIVDGFMLYHQDEDEAQETSSPLIPLLDLKLLLRTSYALAKERREGREYVTTDGIWKDPKGYFDGIVWPNYVRYHRHLFVGNDVEGGQLTHEWGVCGKGVELQPEDGDGSMESLLRWASRRLVDVIVSRI